MQKKKTINRTWFMVSMLCAFYVRGCTRKMLKRSDATDQILVKILKKILNYLQNIIFFIIFFEVLLIKNIYYNLYKQIF